MRSKTKIFLIILTFIVQLSFLPMAHAGPPRNGHYSSEQEIFLTVSLPNKERLTLISLLPITVAGQVVGGLAAYDNAATERPADYLELFNNAGGLLAVSWFDEFGIRRTAVDRSLLRQTDHPEGVFVLLLEGDFI